MAKLSIAIPTYNRETYLKECLDCILRQTFQDFNIYIFDNHSDYDIGKLIASYGDGRIFLITSETNIGSFKNFDRIFNYDFESQYLMIFHDDDCLHPRALELEVGLFDKNQNLVWVSAGLKFVHDQNRMTDFYSINDTKNLKIFDTSGLIRLLLGNFHLAYNTVIYKVEIIKGTNSQDERFFKWNDRPYLIKLSKRGMVGVIKEPLVNYRIHRGQDSQADVADKYPFIIELYKFYRDNLPQPLSAGDKKLFYNWSTNNILYCPDAFSFGAYFNVIKRFKKEELFYLRCINYRGLYYFAKTIFRLLRGAKIRR